MRLQRMLASVLLTSVIVAIPALPEAHATEAWPETAVRVVLDVDRAAGGNRFATAVAAARKGYPGWEGVTHVIVSSGDDRAMADPLAAAGLCWAYDAPLLLVQKDGVPSATRLALVGMVKANGAVKVTVVGGPAAVSASCISQLKSIVGSSGRVEQPWTRGDRFDTAAGIARRMESVASADASRTLPPVVLVANGTNRAGYVDALALSAVSARTGAPILFVGKEYLPTATAASIKGLAPDTVIIAGGPAVVSSAVYRALKADTRWAGADRYATAVDIAGKARDRGWLEAGWVGIAASVPDALVGATIAGREGAPLLYTENLRLSETAARYLDAVGSKVASATVFGGVSVVSAETEAQLGGKPAAPVFVSPPAGGYVGKYVTVKVRTGVNTSDIAIYAGEKSLTQVSCGSYTTVELDRMSAPADGTVLKALASNPEPASAAVTRKLNRLSYPASTSIVIDKSDFRLYWIRNDEIVDAYPIAIGRPSMETPTRLWKINAKYNTTPTSVYGPRKMRLFKQSGSSWLYTNYAIHGTNEPWVIGTKASHGCIRMYNDDVLELFPQVPLGTIVRTRE